MSLVSLADAPLAQRCLALTGAFETSAGIPDCFAGLAGDFDGQGLSLGVCQWNFGQGSLQPLLAEMLAKHEDVMRSVFHNHLDTVRAVLASPRDTQLQWARGIQNASHQIAEPWKGFFHALGATPEFQQIQTEHAAPVYAAALSFCSRFGVSSERAVALMFDIRVQNHSISPATESKIREDFSTLDAGEVPKLQIIANRRAEAASPRFVEDVRKRKLTIANGSGTVHGISYDLEVQFGIGLRKAA